MVITITDYKKKGKKDDVKIYIPVNPKNISCKFKGYFQEYNIINLGTTNIPAGDDITTISWSSFFPGNRLKKQPYVNRYKKPITFHNRLETWRKNGTKLKLNITGTPINFWVHIASYEPEISDAFGSIYYSIEFMKVVPISVDKVKKKTSKNKTSGKRTTKTSSQKKYTVKKGDCLWNISKKFYKTGTQWKKIYNANKSVIEKTAKKYGKKSSSNGHWIFPGTVLKIP